MNTIEETIKLAGWGRKKAMEKQIEMFEKSLQKGEKLLGVGASHPKPTQQIYVTDKRIIVHKIEGIFENKKTEIPLSSISSINISTKGLGATIDIVASNNNASVEHLHIHIAKELKNIIDSLLIPTSGNFTPIENTSVDVADQIKRLAELKVSGILTEEEFSAKKKQLLGI
jgi:hypothetical protein